jgi:hypothetical protein
MQQDFRTGLSWLNSHSQSNSGKAFLSLNPDQQVTCLNRLLTRRNSARVKNVAANSSV